MSPRQQENALRQLRKLGLLHIKHLKAPQSQNITSLRKQLTRLDQALAIIGDSDNQKKAKDREELTSYINERISLNSQKGRLQKELESLRSRAEWFNAWGDISFSSLGELQEAGIFIQLYICPRKEIRKIPEDKTVFVLREEKATAYVAFVAASADEQLLDFVRQEIPDRQLSELQGAIAEVDEKINLIERQVRALGAYREEFLSLRKTLLKEIEFYNVKGGMLSDEGVCYLEGYCPCESLAELSKAAALQGWGSISGEPDSLDAVPTLLRNPGWINIINPVFKFMGTLPGYGEFDISLWFL
ncbi:hypothetical protein ACFL2W_01165, partial [Candidatus Omnitrophota bacterium]